MFSPPNALPFVQLPPTVPAQFCAIVLIPNSAAPPPAAAFWLAMNNPPIAVAPAAPSLVTYPAIAVVWFAASAVEGILIPTAIPLTIGIKLAKKYASVGYPLMLM